MPAEISCTYCGARLRVKDSLAGQNLPCKQCGEALSAPNQAPADERDKFELATSVPKRSRANHRTDEQRRSMAKPPGVVKRIVAVLGIVIGLCIVLFGVYGLARGSVRAGRAIGGGLVLATVCFGWYLGNSD